jgi:hypothetical protein
MPAAIVSSKGGGRIVRAAAPAAAAPSFSGVAETAGRGVFSFGSGGGGGGGSSDITRYRLHVEPANAPAAASASVAGLQVLSSNPSKASDHTFSGAGGSGANRLKPALPHAWMDAGADAVFCNCCACLRAMCVCLIGMIDSAAEVVRVDVGGQKDDVAQLKERLAR